MLARIDPSRPIGIERDSLDIEAARYLYRIQRAATLARGLGLADQVARAALGFGGTGESGMPGAVH